MASGIVEPSTSGSPDQEAEVKTSGENRSKLVQRLLSASPNLPAFIRDLLTTQAIVVAGTEAAGFMVEKRDGQIQLRPIAHIRPDQSTAETRAAALNAFQEIVRPCITQDKDGAIQIGAVTEADQHDPQFCLVTLLRNEGELIAASAVITRCRNVNRAQQRLMSMQLVAGYFDLFTLRRAAEHAQVVAQSHQHVLQLATAVATAEGFESAGMNLCNELALRTGATRVSLGWVKGHAVKMKALSHTEQFDKKQELIAQIERAMEECVDQEEPVQYVPEALALPAPVAPPAPADGADPAVAAAASAAAGEVIPTHTLGTDNVTRAAAALSKAQGGNLVLSLPLRRRDEIVGVVTLEFPPRQNLSLQAATGLAVAVDLLAPQLYDRYQNDRWLITKAGLSIQHGAKLTIGPKHMLVKCIVVLSLAALIFVSVFRPMYHVSAPFQFVAIEKRSLCAPFDGQIKQVLVKPGDRVTKGQVLLKLNTDELEDKLYHARSEAIVQLREAEKDRADETKIADYKIAMATREQYLAEAKLYELQIQQATIAAPEDGQIIQGDLRDRVDTKVQLGDVLMQIAQPQSLRAELTVDDRDIQSLQQGQTGQLATKSLPSRKFPFVVDRVVPMGEAKEGSNIFRIYAKLDYSAPDKYDPTWLPGLEGEASVNIEPKPLLWIWTHRLIDFVRLKIWAWV